MSNEPLQNKSQSTGIKHAAIIYFLYNMQLKGLICHESRKVVNTFNKD